MKTFTVAVLLVISTGPIFSQSSKEKAKTFVSALLKANSQPFSYTKGNFAVSDNGSMNYEIPISCVPGRAGMNPRLSLVYNSNNGNGIVGEGWSISGLSVITRTSQSLIVDGRTSRIEFNDNDRLLLDGQRLVKVDTTVSGYWSNSQNNMTYLTEQNTFKKILSVYSNNIVNRFEVRSKDGLIYHYGSTGDTQFEIDNGYYLKSLDNDHQTISWLLVRIEDLNQNTIDFEYDKQALTRSFIKPTLIKYTGRKNQNNSYFAYIKFNYQNVPTQYKYINGQKITFNEILSSVSCDYKDAVNNNNARAYKIRYNSVASLSKYYISKIEECINGNDCLATEFKWQDREENAKFTNITTLLKSGSIVTEDYQLYTGDFNGDGLLDNANLKVFPEKVDFYVSMNSKGKFEKSEHLELPIQSDSRARILINDFDANGTSDFAFCWLKDSVMNIQVAYTRRSLNGKNLSFLREGSIYSVRLDKVVNQNFVFYSTSDFNGDGLPDIYAYFYDAYSVKMLFGINSLSSTFSFRPQKTLPTIFGDNDLRDTIPENLPLNLGDYDSDGITDLLFSWVDKKGWNTKIFLLDDQLLPNEKKISTISGELEDKNQLNVIQFEKERSEEIIDSVKLERDELVAVKTTSYNLFKNESIPLTKTVYTIDLNFDGNSDLIISSQTNTGWKIWTLLGKGNGTFEDPRASYIDTVSYDYTCAQSFGDFNGDGQIDLTISYSDENGWFVKPCYGYGNGFFSRYPALLNLDSSNFTYSKAQPIKGMLNVDAYVKGFPEVSVERLRKLNNDLPVPSNLVNNLNESLVYFANKMWRNQVIPTSSFGITSAEYFENFTFNDRPRDIGDSSVIVKRIKSVVSSGNSSKLNIARNRLHSLNASGDPLVFEDMVNVQVNEYAIVKFYDYWKPIIADLNGDGITDFALTYQRQPDSDTDSSDNPLDGEWKILTAINTACRSGKVNAISLGNGATIQIAYANTTELGAFDSETLPVNYPSVPYNMPVNVVKSTKSPDGIGGFNQVNYTYLNGITGITGRGFLGFEKTLVTSLSTQQTISKKFLIDSTFAKYGFMPLIDMETYIKKVLIYRDRFKNSLFHGEDPKVVFNYIDQKESQTFDLLSKDIGHSTSFFLYDKYGNLIENKVLHANGQIDLISNEYLETSAEESDLATKQDNLSRWILGRLKRTTVYKSKGSDEQVIRKSEFLYYPITGQLRVEKTLVGSYFEINKEYFYDNSGNKVREVSFPAKDSTDRVTTSYAYSDEHYQRFLTTKTDAENYKTVYKPNPVYGFNEETIDPDNNVSKIDFPNNYDPFGRKKKIIEADGTWSEERTYKCNSCEVPGAAYFKISTNSNSRTPLLTFFNLLDRPIKTVWFDINYNRVAKVEKYNRQGELTHSSLAFYEGRSPAAKLYYTEIERDGLGRVRRMINPDGTANKIEYDGLVTVSTNNQGQKNISISDLLGRKILDINYLNDSVRYAYDLDGNNTEIIDQIGRAFSSKFDKDLGKVIQVYNPNTGHPTIFIYNFWGEIEQIKSGYLGTNITSYAYDKIGRTTVKVEHKSNISVNINAPKNRVEDRIEYKYVSFNDSALGKGKLKSVTAQGDDRKLNKAYLYDHYGRLVKKSFTSNATNSALNQDADIGASWNNLNGNEVALNVSYTYDKVGQLEAIIYPTVKKAAYSKGFVVKYGYENGLLQSVVANGKKIWEYVDGNPDGTLRKEALNDGKLTTEYNYNLLNQNLGNITTLYGGTSKIQKWEYKYDDLGNIKYKADLFNSPGFAEIYAYDELNRVKTVQVNNKVTQYRYDALGNIIYRSDVGYFRQRQLYSANETAREPKLTINRDSLNSIKNDEGAAGDLDEIEYYLDLVGNRYKKEINEKVQFEIKYNHFNKPSTISNEVGNSKTSFYYDEENNLQIEKRGRTVRYYIDGIFEFEDLPGSGINQKFFVYVNGNLIAYNQVDHRVKEDKFFFIHKDALGSVTGITDEKGKLTVFAYNIWGQRLDPTTWKSVEDGFTVGFSGHQQWDELKLINMGGRMYDPTVSQFLQVDPILNLDFPTQGLSAYTYCFNNPLYFKDPTGYWSIGKFFGGVARGVVRAFVAGPTAALLVIPGYRDFIDKNAGTIVTIQGMIAAAILTPMGVPPAVTGFATGFAAAFAQTYLNGGTFGQALEAGMISGVISGVTAGITSGIGDVFMGSAGSAGGGLFGNEAANYAGKAVTQAAFQGAMNEAQGGNFWQGALPALVSAASDPLIGSVGGSDFYSRAGRTAIAATIGGTASVIGGGKFANGAITAAVVHIYNGELHRRNVKIITIRDAGVGTHSALLIEGNDENILYDPAGSYIPKSGNRSGELLTGSDANLDAYMSYHKTMGSTVEVQSFTITDPQKSQILNRINAAPTTGPFYCTQAISSAIQGIGPFANISLTWFPGSLNSDLKKNNVENR